MGKSTHITFIVLWKYFCNLKINFQKFHKNIDKNKKIAYNKSKESKESKESKKRKRRCFYGTS